MMRNDGRETAEPRERSAIAGVDKRHGRSAKDAARPWPGRAAMLTPLQSKGTRQQRKQALQRARRSAEQRRRNACASLTEIEWRPRGCAQTMIPPTAP